MRRHGSFFAPVYALAWLPVLFVYVAFISAVSGWHIAGASVLAVANVLPAALLGLAVVRLCRRLPLPSAPGGSWLRFAALHSGAAAVYSLLWAAGIVLLFVAGRSIAAGRPMGWMLSAGEVQWQLGAGLLVYATIASIVYLLDSVSRAREDEARAQRAEALQARAELQALRAQFNPHFLFNTLHSVLELISTGDPRAEQAVEMTGSLFRYVFDKRSDPAADVPLRRELSFVEDYLNVERLRLGERLRTRIEVDPRALDVPVPPFLIQPLVENCVRHAAAVRVSPTTICLRVRQRAGWLELLVADNGPGASAGARGVRGSGLWLVRRRLALCYPGRYRFRIATAPGDGFRVRVRVPCALRDAAPATVASSLPKAD
jgi:signal transduction histidine kinase